VIIVGSVVLLFALALVLRRQADDAESTPG